MYITTLFLEVTMNQCKDCSLSLVVKKSNGIVLSYCGRFDKPMLVGNVAECNSKVDKFRNASLVDIESEIRTRNIIRSLNEKSKKRCGLLMPAR